MPVLSRRSATADARRATKQSLIASTVALLDEGHAYADLSIEQIVRGAGVSRPTFYSYFQDKRALVLELAAGVREALVEGAEPWLGATDDNAERSLAALLQAYQWYRPNGTYGPDDVAEEFCDIYLFGLTGRGGGNHEEPDA